MVRLRWWLRVQALRCVWKGKIQALPAWRKNQARRMWRKTQAPCCMWKGKSQVWLWNTWRSSTVWTYFAWIRPPQLHRHQALAASSASTSAASSPHGPCLCPYCQTYDETAEHIFWSCTRWKPIRTQYSTWMRLFSLIGTQWPNCFLHCGWIEQGLQYGFPFLESVGLSYSVISFVHDMYRMYLDILLARHTASQVLRSTPLTPPHDPHGPFTPQTIPSSPPLVYSCQAISLFSSQVETTFEARHQCAPKKLYIYIYIHTYVYIYYFIYIYIIF